jgi:uncharacterized RDD family membrane protein YckC
VTEPTKVERVNRSSGARELDHRSDQVCALRFRRMGDWLGLALGVVSVAYGLGVLITPGSLLAVFMLGERDADRHGYRLNFPRLFKWPLLGRMRRIAWGLWLLMYGGFLVWGALSNPPNEVVQASKILLVAFGVIACVVICRWVVSELKRSRRA